MKVFLASDIIMPERLVVQINQMLCKYQATYFSAILQEEINFMLSAQNGSFLDEHGRRIILRGVNLAGSSKIPFRPAGTTETPAEFFDHRHVSFVGRPFPLEQADRHFARLQAWGLTFERLVVPWEAIEHAGPGVYDMDYLDYLYTVVRKAGQHGIRLFIDPHEDVWSRFSGGDGAPGWTFEAAGLDITHFKATGAALTRQEFEGPLPAMIWPTNNQKLAAASMFTLFFAGNDFAPQTRVNGVPIQEYLQNHFINAFQRVARQLADLSEVVVGYDTLNEPGTGYIGRTDLNAAPAGFKVGDVPTPFQSMLLGDGLSQVVDVWEFRRGGPKKIGSHLLNTGRVSAWLPNHECIWRQHGVWELAEHGTARLLRPDYFSQVGGRPVNFNQDYVKPFINRFARAIHSEHPQALIFVETNRRQPLPDWGPEDAGNIVSAPHWYDGTVLFTKKFNAWIGSDLHGGNLIYGAGRIRREYARQVRAFQQSALDGLRGAPTLIGETGIPFDLDDRKELEQGDYSTATRAMDRSLRTMDDALASYTLWTYTPDNTVRHGDLWNDEDLSIFCRDLQTDPNNIDSGGRALEAVVRPYARATAGQALRMAFDYRSRKFVFEFRHDPACQVPTEIFIPNYQYPHGCRVTLSDGRYELDAPTQTLRYFPTTAAEIHRIQILPAKK